MYWASEQSKLPQFLPDNCVCWILSDFMEHLLSWFKTQDGKSGLKWPCDNQNNLLSKAKVTVVGVFKFFSLLRVEKPQCKNSKYILSAKVGYSFCNMEPVIVIFCLLFLFSIDGNLGFSVGQLLHHFQPEISPQSCWDISVWKWWSNGPSIWYFCSILHVYWMDYDEIFLRYSWRTPLAVP